VIDLTASAEWRALADHHRQIGQVHLGDMFAADPSRAESLTLDVGDLHVDFSKQRIETSTIDLLAALAERAGLPEVIDAMFRGDRINTTEDRSVLHAALRAPEGTHIEVDGHDVVSDVHAVLQRAGSFAEAVRSRQWRGHTDHPVETVVNIGIGGSDLGPVMAHEALRGRRHDDIECRFVSNIDGADLARALDGLDPAATLFVVCSKTFTTAETIANAHSARRWLTGALGGDAVSKHFVAVSTNGAAVADFGIDPANMFGFWDWVGGRYSLGSAIGLSLMIAIGSDGFAEMLEGFALVDDHFRSAPLALNVPALMGLVGVWNRNFCGWDTHAVLPYSADLHRFPAYLQQLEMESNGKQVRRDGSPVTMSTAPVVWGEPGTNGQHAFFQLLHQGTTVVPADFIAACRPGEVMPLEAGPGDHHDLLVANCLAQSRALAFGRSADEVRARGVDEALVPHRTFAGNRPSTTILMSELTPSSLGQLIALYEHKVFTQGVIWQIDSFDQWGVELGKELATSLAPDLSASTVPGSAHDPSTDSLLLHYRTQRQR
jgi:glucose-6-phosphate isomerase